MNVSNIDEKNWEWNVRNCRVPVERAVMISDTEYKFEFSFDIFKAGVMLGELDFSNNASMHYCGKWFWIEFKAKEDAMAFKLRWT